MPRDASAEELDRQATIAALDAYLLERDAELGPIPAAETQAAETWATGLPTTPDAGSRA